MLSSCSHLYNTSLWQRAMIRKQWYSEYYFNVFRHRTEGKFPCNSVQALRLTNQQSNRQWNPAVPGAMAMGKNRRLPSAHYSRSLSSRGRSLLWECFCRGPVRKTGEGKGLVTRADIFLMYKRQVQILIFKFNLIN